MKILTTMLIPATTLIRNSSSFPPPCLFRATRLFGREEQVDYLIKVVYPAKEAYRYLAELHFTLFFLHPLIQAHLQAIYQSSLLLEATAT